MAKFVSQHRNPANPEILGADPVRLFFEGLGIGVSGLANDKVAAPLVKRFVPLGDSPAAKLVDALTTAGSAWVVGEFVGFVDQRIGQDMKHGGLILAVARAATAVIPGYQLSETIPFSIGGPAPVAKRMNGAKNGNAPQLTAGQAMAPVQPSYVMNDYPRGVSPTMDVGL